MSLSTTSISIFWLPITWISVSFAKMIYSAKHSPAAFAIFDLTLSKSLYRRQRSSSALPQISSSVNLNSTHSSLKPLYLTSPKSFGFEWRNGSVPTTEPQGLSFKRAAYEANKEETIAFPDEEARTVAAQKLNVYNKKVLNAFPYPWLISTLSLTTGFLMMLISWALRVAEASKIDLKFLKALAPVAMVHTIGYVAATVNISKVMLSFTHIIKSEEPTFSVLWC